MKEKMKKYTMTCAHCGADQNGSGPFCALCPRHPDFFKPDLNCHCVIPDPEEVEKEFRERERLANRYNPLI